MKFYKCDTCGNISIIIGEQIGDLSCCGKKMELIKYNTNELVSEKHIPSDTYKLGINPVIVSLVNHPSTKDHYIEWIAIKYTDGIEIKYFKPGDIPSIEVPLEKYKKACKIYAYCNIHGLWKRNAHID